MRALAILAALFAVVVCLAPDGALTERGAASFVGPRIPAMPRPRSVSAVATAYCIHGTTATGTYTQPGTVAVDPRVIPLGAKLHVSGYGYGRALDTGGAIRGAHVDVWVSSCRDAFRWGVRRVTVRWWA